MTTSTHVRTCPVCTEGLEQHDHEGVTLDRCPAGHGLWLDRGELRAVVASEEQDRSEAEEQAALEEARRQSGQAVVAESSRAARACPVCGGDMRVVEYAVSGVAIDECSEHGAWLDAGELERIEAWAEGIRREAALGPQGARADRARVSGIDVPASLLATLSSAVPPASS